VLEGSLPHVQLKGQEGDRTSGRERGDQYGAASHLSSARNHRPQYVGIYPSFQEPLTRLEYPVIVLWHRARTGERLIPDLLVDASIRKPRWSAVALNGTRGGRCDKIGVD